MKRLLHIPLIIGCLATGCTKVNFDASLREGNLEKDLCVIENSIIKELHDKYQLGTKQLTYEEIIEIALTYNTEALTHQLNLDVQKLSLKQQQYKLLPSLTAEADILSRNKHKGSFSQSLTTQAPAPPSVSSEQHIRRENISLTWNLLDMGIGFYRERQEADKLMMAHFEQQRSLQQIVLSITRNYWKHVAAKSAYEKSKALLEKVTEQEQKLEKQIAAKSISKIDGLYEQNRLLDIQMQLKDYEKLYKITKSRLASDMGIPLSMGFDIETPKVEDLPIVQLDPQDQLIMTALKKRPELSYDDYNERVLQDEAAASYIAMFPGVEVFGGYFQDSNKFLINRNWVEVGTRAVWDLFDVPEQWQHTKKARKQREGKEKSRHLLSLAIMTQVHLAHYLYQESHDRFTDLRKVWKIHTAMADSARKAREHGEVSLIELLSYEADLHFAETRMVEMFAEMATNLELVNNSIGLPGKYQLRGSAE